MSLLRKSQRLALACLILVGWLLALAGWIFAAGGFATIADAPHLTLPIMVVGGICIPIVCMSIVGWPRRKPARS